MISRRQNTEVGILLALGGYALYVWCEIEWGLSFLLIALLLTLVLPVVWTPVTWLWFKIASLLEGIVSRLLLGMLYLLFVWPVGLFRRILGHDPLLLRSFGRGNGTLFRSTSKLFSSKDITQQF